MYIREKIEVKKLADINELNKIHENVDNRQTACGSGIPQYSSNHFLCDVNFLQLAFSWLNRSICMFIESILYRQYSRQLSNTHTSINHWKIQLKCIRSTKSNGLK